MSQTTPNHKMLKRKLMVLVVAAMTMISADADDKNDVFSPCLDATVQRSDGFTFGLAFSDKNSFFSDQVQLSPCDRRLGLSTKNAKLAIFRPTVDEISLLSINQTDFDPSKYGGYMVAFAGSKYAARSFPIMVADDNMIITSFTLVLEFQKGILQNLYWKKFGCENCAKGFVCLNNQDCAIPISKCQSHGGPIDCNINIQLAFSGTDKYLEALNSWYEVSNLRQYSLYGLYSNVRDTFNQFNL